jgi:DNA-binding beta-propeller fold protein YncE
MNKLTAGVLLAGLAVTTGLLVSQPAPLERVGPRPGGGFLLNSGWLMKPAGRQIPLSTSPQASAVSPDGKYVVILQGGYLPPSISLHDAATLAEIDHVTLPDAWLGIAFAPKSNVFYVSGGSTATIFELAVVNGKLERRREFVITPKEKRKHTDFIGDLTISPDGRMIYAAALYRDTIVVVNPQSGMTVDEWKTAHRPYKLLFHPDGKSFYVTGWGDSSLRHHDAANGEQLGHWQVGPQPMDMLWRAGAGEADADEAAPAYQARLFITISGRNTVQVYGVDQNKNMHRLETLSVALHNEMPETAGMTPSALALSSDANSLYVVCADANAVAKVAVSGAHSRVEGFIPVGWYPLAARGLADGRLLVLNGRGDRSYPNPQGPNPTIKKAPLHEGIVAVEYVAAIQRGSASIIPAPTPEQMERYTAEVLSASPYRRNAFRAEKLDAGHPLAGTPSPIEHIIYIVKENRTYDQVLGDLKIGNGDASLTLFTENVSPNHHKLAREFVLLDNFYVNADVSAEGHNWSSSAIVPPYVQRMWPNSYAGRRKHYDYEGGERAALPPAGYLWSNALQKGLTYRNYGWWTTNIAPAPASGRQIQNVHDPALVPCTNMDYRGFDLDYKDTDRVKVFLQDLARFEASGEMPRLITLRLGNDHTSGTAAGKITPLSSMADNDYALGQLVEAVSKSKFWAKTAIFVLEDDAQNGPDHVDSHRSPAFIISPYTRGRGIDSTMYNTVSMLRTMEELLQLAPMTMHDASARLMSGVFLARPNAAPYGAEKPRIPLDDRNPKLNASTRRFDFSEADQADDDAFNDEIWRAIRHTEPPAPVRSFWGR